jgi:WD40 repeat protein
MAKSRLKNNKMAKSDEFKRLLHTALAQIKLHTNKNLSVISDEIGYAIGRKGGSIIEYWGKGNLPSQPRELELLARELVRRGGLSDRRSLESFARSANYPQPTKLADALFGVQKSEKEPAIRKNLVREDWGEAVATGIFYGRETERQTLENWILTDGCRLVAVLGMGGIGKTSLTLNLAQSLKNDFDFIFWRSLRNEPEVEEILTECISFLSDQEQIELPDSLNGKLNVLLNYLKKKRCLLILDNIETILQMGGRAGRYRAGYEGYGRLFGRIGETSHSGCLILTSREKLRELELMEGNDAPVRSLWLGGLNSDEGREILKARDLYGGTGDWAALVERYSGNPLALRLVAANIWDVFGGDIAGFLKEEAASTFGGLDDELGRQFGQLSETERAIIYWLAIERELVPLDELQKNLMPSLAYRELLEVLKDLRWRSLIERGEREAAFTLQAVVMEYTTEQLIEQFVAELSGKHELKLLTSHVLIKAEAKEYIRHIQTRLILSPTIARLQRLFKTPADLENQLQNILDNVRKMPRSEQGYAGGNLVNLLCYLKGDLPGYDFSDLNIWQAHLQGVNLQNVNFARADLSGSVFTQTFSGTMSVAFSLDGQFLALGGADGQIQLWRMSDGKHVATLQGHSGWIWAVAFSPDGKTLGSASQDGTGKLWDTATGLCLRTLQGHSGWVWSVAFSPDGLYVATTSQDETVKLWEVADGECLRTLRGHSNWVWSVAFSPDGQFLASASEDQTARVWNVQSGQCLKTLQHGGRVSAVAFGRNPDDMVLATGSADETVRLWDIPGGECRRVLQSHNGAVWSVAFSPDTSGIASGSSDGTIDLWDIGSGQHLRSWHGNTNLIWTVNFSSDGAVFASGSLDGTVTWWEVKSNRRLRTLYGYSGWIWAVAFNPDGKLLASAGMERNIKLWDTASGQVLQTLEGHNSWIGAIAFSPKAKTLASASSDGVIKFWQLADGHNYRHLAAHNGFIWSIAFSPDGKYLASGATDRQVRLWDVASGECLYTLKEHTGWIGNVAFSPDGKLLASCAADQTIRLWEALTGKCLNIMYGHSGWIQALAFSPDGTKLVTGSADRTIRVWEVATGRCLRTLVGHSEMVWSVAFSPDGQHVVSGGHDRQVRVWDVQSGQNEMTFAGHGGRVWSVACSPSGDSFASGGEDGTVRLHSPTLPERVFQSLRPYEDMNITEVTGLSPAQKTNLQKLGALQNFSNVDQHFAPEVLDPILSL